MAISGGSTIDFQFKYLPVSILKMAEVRGNEIATAVPHCAVVRSASCDAVVIRANASTNAVLFLGSLQ
jgi:hypothetical protein